LRGVNGVRDGETGVDGLLHAYKVNAAGLKDFSQEEKQLEEARFKESPQYQKLDWCGTAELPFVPSLSHGCALSLRGKAAHTHTMWTAERSAVDGKFQL